MGPNENIAILETLHEKHSHPRVLENIDKLIGLYEVLDLLGTSVDGNFNVTLDEGSHNNARLVNDFTFGLMTSLERKVRASLSDNNSSLDLQKKLQILAVIGKVSGSDTTNIEAMLAAFQGDGKGHEIESLLNAEQTQIHDLQDTTTGVLNDALEAGREAIGSETADEKEQRLANEAAEREAKRYKGNPELVERANKILRKLLSDYAAGEDLNTLIKDQKTELETLRQEFLAEVTIAIEKSRTAKEILQTEILQKGPIGNPTITPVPGYETFEERLTELSTEVEKIFELDSDGNPKMGEEELLTYIQGIEIEKIFEKENTETFEDLIDTFEIDDPEYRDQFTEMMKEAYFQSQRLANRLQQESESSDLTIQIAGLEKTFDSTLEKRRTIAVGLQLAKALAETPEGIESLVTDKDGAPTLIYEKLKELYNSMPTFGTDINGVIWIALLIVGPPFGVKGILKGVTRFNRPNINIQQERNAKLTEVQKFLTNIGEEKSANRIQYIIDNKLKLPEKYFRIEFHRIVYKQSLFMNWTIFGTLRKFGAGGVRVGERNTLFNGDRTPRRQTRSSDIDSISKVAASFNEAFDTIQSGGIDDSIKTRLVKTLKNQIEKGQDIDIDIVKQQVIRLSEAQNHKALTSAGRKLIQDMILDGKISTDDVTMNGLFSTDTASPGVVNDIRRAMSMAGISGKDDIYDIVLKKFLEGEALDDRIITPDEVEDLKRQADQDVRYIGELTGRGIKMEQIQGIFELQKINVNEDLFGPNGLENSKAYGMMMALKAQLELDGKTGDITRLSEIIRDPRIIASIDDINTTNLATFKESLGKLFGVELENMLSLEEVDEKRGKVITVGDKTYNLRGLTARERIRLATTFRGSSLESRIATLVASGKAIEQLSDDTVESLRVKMNNAFEIITRAELQAELTGTTGVDFDHFRTLATDGIKSLDLTTIENDITSRAGFADLKNFDWLINERLKIEGVPDVEADGILRAFNDGLPVERLDPSIHSKGYFDYLKRAFRRGRI